jgi:hypothetical protein
MSENPSTQTAQSISTSVTSTGLRRLDGALQKLQQLGIIPAKREENPVVALVQEIQPADNDRAVIIARTLHQAGFFNEIARRETAGIEVGEAFARITTLFDSILEDSRHIVDQLKDGKIDWKERLSNKARDLIKGSFPSRFEKIRSTYNDAVARTNHQIEREQAILTAYTEFRAAMKEAEVAAREITQTLQKKLDDQKVVVTQKTAAVDQTTGDVAKAKAELDRDESIAAFKQEEHRFDIAKKLADNLSIGYQVGETVMMKLQQTNQLKSAVRDQAVIFFSTNEPVFTALCATLTSEAGLSEATRTTDALKAGMNKSLETLAELTGKSGEAAIRTAYGKTIEASSVKKLVDAIVEFQSSAQKLTEQMRQEATKNAAEIETIVNDGKRRYAELIGLPPKAALN